MFSTLQFLSVALALLLIASPAPAQVVIYLDFDHHEDLAYPLGSSMLAISVPAFTGNAAARASIQAAIEEDFAPFNVTVDMTSTVKRPDDAAGGGYRHSAPPADRRS
jgi:hypothetical protein